MGGPRVNRSPTSSTCSCPSPMRSSTATFGHDPWAEGVPKSFEPVLELRCDLLAGVRSRASGGDDRLAPVARELASIRATPAGNTVRGRPCSSDVPWADRFCSDMVLRSRVRLVDHGRMQPKHPRRWGLGSHEAPFCCDRGRHNAPVHPLGSSRPNRSARSNRPKRVASAPRASLSRPRRRDGRPYRQS